MFRAGGVVLVALVGVGVSAGCSDVGEDPEDTAVAFVEALQAGDVRAACKLNVSEGVVTTEDEFLLSVCEGRAGQAFTDAEIEEFLGADRVVDQHGARAVVIGGNTRVALVKVGQVWHTEYHFEQGEPAPGI